MNGENKGEIYEFGSFRLDAARRLLYRDGQTVPLAPKVVDTLLVLVENAGSVVHKETLLRRVWPDTFVDENNLAQNISVLRRALENDGSRIETVPKRGYRLVTQVRTPEPAVIPTPQAEPASSGRAKWVAAILLLVAVVAAV